MSINKLDTKAKAVSIRPKGVVKTQNAAAKALKVTAKTIFNWKKEGGEAAGFRVDGSVDLAVLSDWCETRRAKRDGSMESKEVLVLEQIRKYRLANDLKEGSIISRAWVASKIQVCAGSVNAIRTKSEAEHPLKFAAAKDDVPACRTILRGIWDEILTALADLGKNFEESR
jgi:hypothetical protein